MGRRNVAGASMVDKGPINPTLADAFGAMLHGYAAGDWRPDSPNSARAFLNGSSYDYESFSNAIIGYEDELPGDLLQTLLSIPDGYLKAELGNKNPPSYSDAAQALLRAMGRRKDDFRTSEEIRRSRE